MRRIIAEDPEWYVEVTFSITLYHYVSLIYPGPAIERLITDRDTSCLTMYNLFFCYTIHSETSLTEL